MTITPERLDLDDTDRVADLILAREANAGIVDRRPISAWTVKALIRDLREARALLQQSRHHVNDAGDDTLRTLIDAHLSGAAPSQEGQ